MEKSCALLVALYLPSTNEHTVLLDRLLEIEEMHKEVMPLHQNSMIVGVFRAAKARGEARAYPMIVL